MAAAVAEIAAGPSADAPAPAAAAAAAPAAAEVAPEKVDLPDKAAFERKVEALKATMAANKREKETLQARAGARGAGPSKSSKDFQAAVTHKKAIREEFNAARAEASKLIGRSKELRDSRAKVATELREGRTTMSAEEIDRHIDDIDERLSSEGHTMSLKAEKDLVKQRTELNKQKRESAASGRSRDALESKKRAAEAELDSLRAAITAAKEKSSEAHGRLIAFDVVVNEAKTARDAERSGSDDTRGRVRELAQLNNKAYAELKALQDAHYGQLKKAYAFRDWDRKRRDAERQARYKSEEADYADREQRAEAEAEEMKPDHAWATELVELDMLAAYLRDALPAAEPAAAVTAADAPPAVPSTAAAAFAGLGLSDPTVTSTRGKGRKGRGRGKAKPSKTRELSFDLATLAMFGKFKLDAPLSEGEVAETLAKVVALHAEYETKPPKEGKKKAAAEKKEEEEEAAAEDKAE